MGAFTLTNGALLGGLALLVAPVIAHLLQRRARKPIVFPSIAFLVSTAAQQSRLHKLKRLLLLLLRVIAIACVVLAFTRPVWWNASLRAGEQAAASATVILIDASLSTSQQAGGGPLFDRLKAEATRELNDLRPGVDLAAVIWATDQPQSIFPRLSANLPALVSEITAANSTESRADFAASMSLVSQLLETHSGPKRLILLTDRQSSNWKADRPGDTSELHFPAGVPIIIPEIDWTTSDNAAITGLTMSPERPRPAAAVEITATIRNHADHSREAHVVIDWQLANSRQNVGRQSAIVAARASSQISLQSTVPENAIPTLRGALQEADALDADNITWLTASLGEGLPVVIASDDSPDDAGSAAFYLTRALAPFDEQSESRSSFAPRHVSASRLMAADLQDARVVFLGYAGVLKTDAAKSIADFVKRGGSLVVFAGDGPADRNVQLLDDAANGTLMPWRLLSRVDAPRRSPAVIDGGRWNSRWLREFDEPSQLVLREIAFRRTWSSSAAVPDAETLLTFANGTPAMGLRYVERGHCLLVNFSPENTTGDLGKTGTFVALIQMLTSLLAADESDRATFIVGDRIRFAVPKDLTGTLTVVEPDGTTVIAPGASSAGEVSAGRARQSGIYRLVSDGQEISAAAVNVDPRESPLDRLTIAELRRLLGESPPVSTSPESTTGSAAANTQLDGGRPLWGEFLLGGLAAIALELFLLGLWRR